jgi:hypothetical protein
MAVLIPTIKWSQNDEYVIINLEINQVKNDVYEINNNNIIFTGVSNTDLTYSINIELLSEINKDESKYILEERIIRFVLKKTSDEKWIRLTKDKNQYKSNIKVNWDSFIDSDEEDISEENQYPNQQFDLSSMMGGENNMAEMMKNMNPSEMEQLMKSMNLGGESNADEDEDEDEDACEDEDEELKNELDDIIKDDESIDDNESIDSDDLCQECNNN